MRTGRVFGGMLCLSFVMVGFVAVWLMGQEAWKDLRTHFWKPADCTIVRSEAAGPQAQGETPYSVVIHYEYHWKSRSFTSEQIHRKARSYEDYREVQRLLNRYPYHGAAQCFVNPKHPEEAILEKSTPWIALFLLVPVGFIILGSFGFYAAIFGQSSRMTKGHDDPIEAATSGRRTRAAFLFSFFVLLFTFGAVVLFQVFARPILDERSARAWNRVECAVISSRVKHHHHGREQPTYSVDILYEYQVDGRPYRSNRYGVHGARTHGRAAQESIVRQNPPGHRAFCYVNPADPTEAVLKRQSTENKWPVAIPLTLMLAGAGGMFHAWRSRRFVPGGNRSSIRTADTTKPGDPAAALVVLRSNSSRRGKFIGSLLFAGFWNGVVSVFVVQLFRGAARGGIDWIFALFLIPFVVIGLLMLGLTGYFFLALFAPRTSLNLSTTQIRLGESADLTWHLTGRVHVIEKLRIYLEGREEATYRRGTSTSTDRNVFAEIDLATPIGTQEIASGQTRVTVPANTAPSFSSPNNRIVWSLRVKGVIHLYPDVDDSFPIEVLPLSSSRTPTTNTDS